MTTVIVRFEAYPTERDGRRARAFDLRARVTLGRTLLPEERDELRMLEDAEKSEKSEGRLVLA